MAMKINFGHVRYGMESLWKLYSFHLLAVSVLSRYFRGIVFRWVEKNFQVHRKVLMGIFGFFSMCNAKKTETASHFVLRWTAVRKKMLNTVKDVQENRLSSLEDDDPGWTLIIKMWHLDRTVIGAVTRGFKDAGRFEDGELVRDCD